MKILAAGDLHGDSGLARKLANKAEKEKAELVILCGDISAEGENIEGMIGPFVKKGQKVLVIPGNHESIATTDFLADFYGIKNLHGYTAKYKDIGFFGCSGVNIGIHQLDEDEIFNLLKRGHKNLKNTRKKIMVTHTPPTNTKMEKLSHKFLEDDTLSVASKGVEKAITKLKPDILICSHLHEAEGIEEKIGKTKIINVGKFGKIIDL